MNASCAPPGTWKDVTEATPLLSWKGDDLAVVERSIQGLLRDWAAEWGMALDPGTVVQCTLADEGECSTEGWDPLGARSDGGAWFRWTPQSRAWLAAAWFASTRSDTPIVAAVVQACREDFLQRMCRGLHLAADLPAQRPLHACWQRWSGAVLAQLPNGIGILVEPGAIRGLLQQRPARHESERLTGVAQALAGTELRVLVELAGCELALGDLQGLQVGDVLRLSHPTDSPAVVRSPGGDVLFGGWLASTRGRRVIELAPAAPRRAPSRLPKEPT